jgi:uncharacterized phage protein (predicted DNA packaging)
MAYVTLDEVKAHLRIDFDDDDTYITELIDVAENAISVELEEDLADLETEGAIPKGLKHGILLLVGHFYAVKEPVVIGTITAKIPLTFEWIISAYKNWTIK